MPSVRDYLPRISHRNSSTSRGSEVVGSINTNVEQLTSGKLATVTISRPKKLNALNSDMLAAFSTTLQDLADSHSDLTAVILTGEGSKAFIGGADIVEMAAITNPADARTFIRRIHSACKSIRECPVPVIARINGIALGAGLEIAASCDLRVASSNAVLGMPEGRMGLPSVVEAALLPGLIGWGRARQLMYLGETLSAEEGLRWGLVEKVVEPGQLDEAVAQLIGGLEKCGPNSVRSQKVLMRRWEELGIEGAIQASIDHFGQAFEKPSEGDAEPVRMMGEFLRKQREKKNKL